MNGILTIDIGNTRAKYAVFQNKNIVETDYFEPESNDLTKLLQRHPEDPMRLAIEGMLPGGILGRRLCKNFRIYAGAEHPHTPQNPKPLEVWVEENRNG